MLVFVIFVENQYSSLFASMVPELNLTGASDWGQEVIVNQVWYPQLASSSLQTVGLRHA